MVDVCQDGGARPVDERLESLYISYDGLLEPLGASQIVPYVSMLAKNGVRTRILSFEKPADSSDAAHVDALRARLESHGIQWTALRYHRRPRVIATALDLLRGVATAIRLARATRPQVVHARSYVAGLIGWAVKFLFRARFVFDMRGFWPEERVELGLFRPQGLLYRTSKRSEHFLLDGSDHVVVLTESARAILRDREARARLQSRPVREKQISVVPCCADLNRFRPCPPDTKLRREHDLEGRVVIGNIGAVNKRYMLSEIFRFAFHIKSHRPEMRFVYLTRQPASPVYAVARDAGLQDEDVLVRPVDPDDVPRWLSLMRLGVFFLQPSYAAKASSYTKLAEFLASGVPVVTNKGVGDVERLFGSSRCGLLLSGLRDGDLAAGAKRALPFLEGADVPAPVRERCRRTAEAHFDLHEGAGRYLSIYRSLAFPGGERPRTSVAVELG